MKVVDERVSASYPIHSIPRRTRNTFANDGQPISKTTWIENGVVKNLSYDRYWAQKQGKEPTAHEWDCAHVRRHRDDR